MKYLSKNMARKAKQYLSHEDKLLDKYDMLFFEAQERFKISEWDQSIQLVKEIQENGLMNTKDRRASCELTLGRCYRRKNELKLAIAHLQEAFHIKVKHESWVTPHALFEIGVIYLLENDNDTAIKKFNKVKSNYDGYDFRNILLREVALWIDKSNGIAYSSFVDTTNY